MFTPEQILAAQKSNVETMMSVANTLFASSERLIALNLNTARSAFEDSMANSKALMNVKAPQDLLSLQQATAQPTMEKAVTFARGVYEIASQTNEELAKLLEGQYVEANKGVAASLDKLAKNSPAGSDVAVAAVKSALAAANSAYDSVSKVARQVAEVAEANVAAATNATVKAVNAATPAAKTRKAA
jgi:phasin family protein